MTDAAQASTSPPPRRLARRVLGGVLHGLGWLLRTVVIALVGLVLVLGTDWGKDRLRAIVVGIVDDSIQGSIEIGGLSGSLVGEIVLEDIVVRDPDGLEVRIDVDPPVHVGNSPGEDLLNP